jgi:hypothetical protein
MVLTWTEALAYDSIIGHREWGPLYPGLGEGGRHDRIGMHDGPGVELLLACQVKYVRNETLNPRVVRLGENRTHCSIVKLTNRIGLASSCGDNIAQTLYLGFSHIPVLELEEHPVDGMPGAVRSSSFFLQRLLQILSGTHIMQRSASHELCWIIDKVD